MHQVTLARSMSVQATSVATLSSWPLRTLGFKVCLTFYLILHDSYPSMHIVPALSSVVVTSNKFQPVGSDFIATCTVELSPAVVESDLSVVIVDAQLSRDGTPLTLTGPTVAGTTFTYTIQLDSFEKNGSGNYTCTATVRPQQSSTFLTGGSVLSNTVSIKAGMHHLCMPSRIQCSHFSSFLQLLLPLSMCKPLRPVSLPQWRSAGVLHLVELLPSLVMGSSMAMERMYQCLLSLLELSLIHI